MKKEIKIETEIEIETGTGIESQITNQMTNQITIQKNRARCYSIFWMLGLILTTFSCSNIIYEEKVMLEESVWTADKGEVTFNFSISDTNQLYHIYLEAEHKTSYPFQNIYCLVESSGPAGAIQSQVVSLELSSKKGKWYGDCNNVDCTRNIPFITYTKFQKVGDYSISLKQHSRESRLEGINYFRLQIAKAEQPS